MNKKIFGGIIVTGILGSLVLGLSLGLSSSGGSDALENDAVVVDHGPAPGGSADWAFVGNVDRLVERSDLIIIGELVGQEETEVFHPQLPERISVLSKYNKSIRVLDVLKGTTTSDVILVGQGKNDGEPQIEGVVYLFLKELDHSAMEEKVPYDYIVRGGPQDQFQVKDGMIVPMAPDTLSTTQQFKGVRERAFVEAIEGRVSN